MSRAGGEPGAALAAADWKAAFALLDLALDLPASERQHWLDTLGAEHAALRPTLERLLARSGHGETDAFLAVPAARPARLVGTDRSGTQVGPYRLMREIGRGGMATVWLAERTDGLLDRQVALKIAHLGGVGPGLAERMARERQILGSLTHAHIARLYDAGVGGDGRPWMALEHIVGQPITAFAQAHGLGAAARVQLVVQVARAVAHAHARLVIHRDLKPSNVVVDAAGHTHLLDFGIAKIVDPEIGDQADGGVTQMTGRALTPDYASPEQLRGEAIGTATDVYSLGVVLFELLAGERPHRFAAGMAPAAMADALDAPPPRASERAADPTVAKRLQGDLDAVCARALAPLPGERYATMDAFADDLERHLRGEPVRARPDTPWYRAERWLRRHKLESAAIVAVVVAIPAGAGAQVSVLIAIALGAAVALWQARAARQAQRRAEAEAARASAVTDFLAGFFKAGGIEEDGGRRLGRMSVQDFLARGAKQIDAGFARAPAVRASLLEAVSGFFADLADGAATVEYARKWQQAIDEAGGSDDERDRAARRLAEGLALTGQHAEGVKVLEARLSRHDAGRTGMASLEALAGLQVQLSRLFIVLGDLPRATSHAEAALALQPKDGARSAAVDAVQAEAAFVRADVLGAKRVDEAVPAYEDALRRLEASHGARSTRLGRYRFAYGSALIGGRRDADGIVQLRHALSIFREAGGDDDLDAAIVALDLGRILTLIDGGRPEGLAMLGEAGRVFASRGDAVAPVYTASVAIYLAEGLIDDGDLDAAAEPMDRAMALFESSIEEVAPRSAARLIQARYLTDCGDYPGAVRVLEAAREERIRAWGEGHPHVASALNRIGLNLQRLGRLDEARAAFEEVESSQNAAEEMWGSIKHLARRNLAMLWLEEGDADRAEPVLREQWDAYLAAVQPEARNIMSEASLALGLGRALMAQRRFDEAVSLLQRSVDCLVEAYPRVPLLALARSWLGMARLAAGEVDVARVLAAQAGATFAAQPRIGAHYRFGWLELQRRLAEPIGEAPERKSMPMA